MHNMKILTIPLFSLNLQVLASCLETVCYLGGQIAQSIILIFLSTYMLLFFPSRWQILKYSKNKKGACEGLWGWIFLVWWECPTLCLAYRWWSRSGLLVSTKGEMTSVTKVQQIWNLPPPHFPSLEKCVSSTSENIYS